jgi:hypothetical protein
VHLNIKTSIRSIQECRRELVAVLTEVRPNLDPFRSQYCGLDPEKFARARRPVFYIL